MANETLQFEREQTREGPAFDVPVRTVEGEVVMRSSDQPVAEPRVTPAQRMRQALGAGFRIPRPPLYLTSLIVFVIIPSLLVQFYLAFIASDQFQAEARFAVRSPEDAKQAMNAISSMSGGMGLSAPSLVGQDAHVVVSYVKSRAILDDLKGTIDVHAIYTRPEADFWARLPKDASIETTLDYWKEMVTTNVDGPSGIVTIYVKAFRREDAVQLANAIIGASEKLVNRISDRAKRDTMERAETEVRRSESMVREALSDMRALRERVGFIDPVATATATSRLITQAMVEKIKLENDLFVANRVSPNAPTTMQTATRLQSVNEQIDKLKATLTSDKTADNSLTKSLVLFEEAELKRMFAEKLYSMAQDALERARTMAERQAIYVTVFVPASLPQEAGFPERLHLSIAIPVSLLVVWGIFALLAATIEDHRI